MRLHIQSTRPSTLPLFDFVTTALVVLSAVSSVTGSDLIHAHQQYSSDLAKRLVGREQFQYDTGSVPVARPVWNRRQLGGDGNDDSSSSSTPKATTTRSSKTASGSPTITPGSSSTPTASDGNNNSTSSSTSSSAVPTYTAKTLPVPFDTSIGNNFTTTDCPTFFQSFLANSTFRSCAPVSLLLQNSLSFFQAVRSPPVLTKTLDASCSANLAVCSPLMSSIASNLISDSNCGNDYRRQNPLVTQAYAGLVAYEAMYKASCLKDSKSNTYCFWDAFTNANNNTNAAADSYPYYTAIGIDLPTTAKPTCTTCLKQTMQIFAGYARMKGQPVADTYIDTAKHLNTGCGGSFSDANVQVAVQVKPNAASRMVGDKITITGLVAFFTVLLLQL